MCRHYGVAEISDKLFMAISSKQNENTLKDEIFNLIKSESNKIDITKVETLHDYYKAQYELWKLNTQLSEAEQGSNFDEIDNLKDKIEEMKAFVRREFLFLPLKIINFFISILKNFFSSLFC